jgi:hypothetical protein
LTYRCFLVAILRHSTLERREHRCVAAEVPRLTALGFATELVLGCVSQVATSKVPCRGVTGASPSKERLQIRCVAALVQDKCSKQVCVNAVISGYLRV